MDTPEEPTVWPPAPTLAPPEIPPARRFRVNLPRWMVLAIYRALFGAALWTVSFLLTEHHVLSWRIYVLILVAAIAVGWGEECIKRRERR